MSNADSKGNKKSKYMSKPKFSREKTMAYDENDIIKNEQILSNEKEERDKIRKHNLMIASGEIENTKVDIDDNNEDIIIDVNKSKKRKEKKD
uniref:Uncharacterized protein n=1 Tax=viral metagenome TaxID=1070528 RepID=A0A6C0IF54_9ZZZZ